MHKRMQKAALTIKTATGVFKTRDSCRPDLAMEPSINVPVTDCNDNIDDKDQDLDKDHPSTQLFVPVKTAPKKRKRKGYNREILTEAVYLLIC